MNYSFKVIKDDVIELSYKKEKKEFKRTIEDKKKIESVNVRARTKMMLELSKMGMTKNDFVIKKEVDGKIIYDETNYHELENDYVGTEVIVIIDEIIQSKFNMTIDKLWEDIGYTTKDTKELQIFIQKFTQILNGGKEEVDNTPSEE